MRWPRFYMLPVLGCMLIGHTVLCGAQDPPNGLNNNSVAANSTVTCMEGSFRKDSGCLTCHCHTSCKCKPLMSGCEGCGTNRCAVGYTSFPYCQMELPTPDIGALTHEVLDPDTVRFTITSKPSISGPPEGLHYYIECVPQSDGSARSGSLLFVDIPFSNVEIKEMDQDVYNCTYYLQLNPDRSNASPMAQVKPCHGWTFPMAEDLQVGAYLREDAPHWFIVNLTLLALPTFDCDPSVSPVYQILIRRKYDETAIIDRSVESVTAVYDNETGLSPDTEYSLELHIHDDYLDVTEILTTSFTTGSVVAPRVSAVSSNITQLPGTVDVSFPLWDSSSDTGNVRPDGYEVQYRRVNHSLPLAWASLRAEIFGETAKARIEVLAPGLKYEYRIKTTVTVYGETFDEFSENRTVTTLPCGEPSTFDLLRLDYVGTPDQVIVELSFSKADPNCSGTTSYSVEVSRDGHLTETRCGVSVKCQIENLEPFTNYSLSVVAMNQADLKTRSSNTTEIQTPVKAPFSPTNVTFTVSEVVTTEGASQKRNVAVAWVYADTVRRPVAFYTVQVVGLGDEVNVGTYREFTFAGDVYKDYTVQIRGSNSDGVGGREISEIVAVPATEPGIPRNLTLDTLDRHCVNISWEPPQFDGGVITAYKVACSSINVHGNASVSLHMVSHTVFISESRALTTRLCALLPGSLYNCSVLATNLLLAGDGPSTFMSVWTEPNKPLATSEPKLVAEDSTDSTFTLLLPLADNRDMPVSVYYVALEHVSMSSLNTSLDVNELTSKDFARYNPDTLSSGRYITAVLTEDASREFSGGFVVGDGESYNGYYNAPLTAKAAYRVYYGVEVRRGRFMKQTFILLDKTITVKKYSGPVDKQVVIAVVASVVTMLFVFIVLIAIFIVVKKRRSGFTRRPTLRAELIPLKRRRAVKSPDSESPDKTIVPGPISVQHLRSYINAEHTEISRQYKSLPTGLLSTVNAATNPNVRDKNRFANILPYDHSRVILSSLPEVENSDYINANYIDGYSMKRQYIATSGPKPSTSRDFWRMVWEQRATCIVMVTRCVEEGKVKCEKYWPDDRETDMYGELEVSNTSTEEWSDFTMKTFNITKPGDAQQLTCHHFLFLSWPDHGVPKNSTPFLLFRRKILSFSAGMGSPLIVHCSAGVGRTGTFIAIDSLLEQAEKEGVVDVFHRVQSLRSQRISMVQTIDQYHYIYQAVCEALETNDFYYSAPKFQDSYSSWQAEEVSERQFEHLSGAGQSINESDFEVGREKENKTKNQNPNVLPNDLHRAHIITQPRGYATYINAVFVNSWRSRNMFMATQIPLRHTVDDYLRLLYDQEVSTVVCLEADPQSNQKFGVYLPTDTTTPLETNLFTVTMTEVNDLRADIVVADISITYKQARGEATRSFRHFQANFWSQEEVLPPESHRDTFTTLLEQVEKCHQRCASWSPICVQCRDGNERTSLMLSVWNALDRLKTEQEIDVYHTVELIRIVRPQAITSPAQYHYIYDMLYAYLQEFDLYANYR